MLTIDECIQQLKENAETIDSSAPEIINDPVADDVIRQGDLYFVCLEETPEGKVTKQRQLVPGNTQGSRHVLEGNVEIRTVSSYTMSDRLFKRAQALGYKGEQTLPSELTGPAFRVTEGQGTAGHPEHGDKIYPEGSDWQCVYQQSWGDQVRRVQD